MRLARTLTVLLEIVQPSRHTGLVAIPTHQHVDKQKATWGTPRINRNGGIRKPCVPIKSISAACKVSWKQSPAEQNMCLMWPSVLRPSPAGPWHLATSSLDDQHLQLPSYCSLALLLLA